MKPPRNLLVVDDEQAICWALVRIGEQLGCVVRTAASAEDALAIASGQSFDAIVLDVRMPGMNGLEALPQLRRLTGAIPIVVMTAFGDLKTAVEAVRLGAFDYVVKPFDAEKMRAVLRRALAEPTAVAEATDRISPVAGFVGQSQAMQNVFARLALAAASDANILVCGESGTGKELVARAIHEFSARAHGPFVVVNLAALSPSLAESELFGHVRGSFTGAEHARTGLLVQADSGTLFLDEVADIPLPIQVKLLRAIEQREVVPVGSNSPVASNFRVIAATHRDIERLVQEGQFRHDLFFRVSAFRIDVPPLRERREDILPLAEYFVGQFARTTGTVLSRETSDELRRRSWWGNVRELRNVVEHATILARGGVITPDHLSPPLQNLDPDRERPVDEQIQSLLRRWAERQVADDKAAGQLYEALLRLVERPVFEILLQRYAGQVSPAAKSLGLHRTTLRKKLEAYGLTDQ